MFKELKEELRNELLRNIHVVKQHFNKELEILKRKKQKSWKQETQKSNKKFSLNHHQ